MNYLERLILRALAVPREHAGTVFDPFDQTAAWPRDVLPRAGAPAAAPVAPAVPAPMHALPETTLVPAPRPATAPAPPADPLRQPEPSHHAETHLARPAPTALPLEPPLPAPRAALARADAFMDALGVKRPAQAEPAPSEPKPPVESLRARQPAPHAPAEPPAAAPPALLRPTLPRDPVPSAPVPARGAARAGTAAGTPAATPARAAKTSPVPERIVQTTVLLGPGSGRFDALAQSNGVSRFGIAQG